MQIYVLSKLFPSVGIKLHWKSVNELENVFPPIHVYQLKAFGTITQFILLYGYLIGIILKT